MSGLSPLAGIVASPAPPGGIDETARTAKPTRAAPAPVAAPVLPAASIQPADLIRPEPHRAGTTLPTAATGGGRAAITVA